VLILRSSDWRNRVWPLQRSHGAKAGVDGNTADDGDRQRSCRLVAYRWYWQTLKVFCWESGWKVPLLTRAKDTLAEARVPRPKGRPRQNSERVIAGRGYDCDPQRERRRKRGIEMIAPYRSNNREQRHEDRRKLRRCRRRWSGERTNGWLGQFRRLLARHEHLLSTSCAFFYVAGFRITLRRYV